MSLLKYWVWLSSVTGVSSETKNRLLEQIGNPQDVYYASGEQLGELVQNNADLKRLSERSLDKAEFILNQCARSHITIITIQDGIYPVRLRNIYDPPMVLYVQGRLPVMDEEAAVAIAGTRRCTPYGTKMGMRFGYEITKGGGLIVSGLAQGIDTAGALGALRAGGSCIGVLGTAIDEVYPRSNKDLFEDVKSVGAIVSEYHPGYPMAPGNFPRRNRIMSGLSAGVLIIEAPKRSGALITANLALEQGRELFIVPGNVDAPASGGSNELMKDSGKPVTSGLDVLYEFERVYPEKIRCEEMANSHIINEQLQEGEKSRGASGYAGKSYHYQDKPEESFVKLRQPVTKKVIDKPEGNRYIDFEKVLEGLSESQLKIVSAMDTPSVHIDDIIEKSGLNAAAVLSELTLMEISGVVIQEKGKRFSLNIISK